MQLNSTFLSSFFLIIFLWCLIGFYRAYVISKYFSLFARRSAYFDTQWHIHQWIVKSERHKNGFSQFSKALLSFQHMLTFRTNDPVNLIRIQCNTLGSAHVEHHASVKEVQERCESLACDHSITMMTLGFHLVFQDFMT